jgi:hypothetical protein
MIAPSPDWFVGVSGLSLRSGDLWIDELVVDLDPYDAGTDSGISFGDPDSNTNPQDPISLITGFPFTGTGPLGTFTFEFIRTLEACEDGVDNDQDGLIDFPLDPDCSAASDSTEDAEIVDPGPSLPSLSPMGLGLLAAGLLGIAQRRLRAGEA